MSIEERYTAAVSYVRRAVDTVERTGWNSSLVDWYAARNRTEPARDELAHVEARWLRATNDIDRARIARDAELLADHTQETLPGAPQDRARTNLWKGEIATSTAATSYADELEHQAHDVWNWTKNTLRQTANDAVSIGTWLLIGGGILLALKIGKAQKRDQLQAGATRRALSRQLERAAAASDGERP